MLNVTPSVYVCATETNTVQLPFKASHVQLSSKSRNRPMGKGFDVVHVKQFFLMFFERVNYSSLLPPFPQPKAIQTHPPHPYVEMITQITQVSVLPGWKKLP